MNARVFLLLIVTGLFMAAWNSDQAAEQQFLAQRAQKRAAMAVVESDRHGMSTPSVGQNSHHAQLTAHIPESHTAVCRFQPDGMAAGVYRAVSETGVTFELTVTAAASQTPREFYVADSPDGRRWYFVRIQTAE